MALLSSRNGFRGEYLARYIVSRFAFISESSVGEDYGIDFYCGLNTETKNIDGIELIQYDKPFILQIKTSTKGGSKKSIVFSEDQIKTIYNLEIPLFIGYLNLKTKILDIHSTSPMWFPYMLFGFEPIKTLKFKFRTKTKTKTNVDLYKPSKNNNQFDCIVDLGLPLISIDISNLETNHTFVNDIRKIISDCIDAEFENISSKRLGLSYFRWMYNYETNRPETLECGYKFVNNADDTSFNKTSQNMIDAMHPYLVSLAVSAKNFKDKNLYEDLIKITRRVSPTLIFNDVLDDYKEVYIECDYDESESKDLSDYVAIATSGKTYSDISSNNNCKLVTMLSVNNKPSPIFDPKKKGKNRKQ